MNIGSDSLREKLDRLPPIICRLLARDNGRLISDVELAKRTGWCKTKLRRLYRAKSWGHVKVGDVDKFLAACGMKWSTQRRQRRLLKIVLEGNGIENMKHMKASTRREAAMIAMIIRHVNRLLS